MVARDDEDGYPILREIKKYFIDHSHYLVRDACSKEKIAAVHHEMGTGLPGIIQYFVKVIKEIWASPSALDARFNWIIKSQVSVGQEYYAQRAHFLVLHLNGTERRFIQEPGTSCIWFIPGGCNEHA